MNQPSPQQSGVSTSFGRCLMKPDFFDRFYDIFLASTPTVKEKFKNTDFSKQKQLLRQGLSASLLYAQGSGSAKFLVDNLRKTHAKDRLDIHPSMYPFWVDSLIKTVAESDPKFSPELEKEWRQTIAQVVDYISAGYQA
ncbi:MAG: globin [Deltaproteobacteria bacterium]|nr:globin [Deltaproteobacteria bacterium]